MNGPLDNNAGIDELSTRARKVGKVSSMNPEGAAQSVREKSVSPPFVSIIMFVRNGMPHVRRAVRSVLAQDYLNFEFVIQDGASTDDTVEYLRGLNDPRIKIVSEEDDGPADAFARAIARCRGDIIASCLADEELIPGALSRAAEIFGEHPHLGAITGDAHITDLDGNIYAKFTGGPFNLIKYLNGEYCPYWCSSFFNINALRFVGIFDKRWSKASLEFEIWCRLAMETDILYTPEIFSKYAHHANQLSQAGHRVEEEIEARLTIIRNHLFGRGKYFGENYGLRDMFILMQLINLHRHMMVWNPAVAESVLQRIVDGGFLAMFNSTRRIESGAASIEQLADPEHAHGTAAREQISGARALSNAQSAEPSAPEIYTLLNAPTATFKSEHIPLHEFIIPRERFLGRLYQKITPRFVRRLVPRDLKIRIARILQIRG